MAIGVVLATVLAASGCSSSGGALDCARLREDNCWKQALSKVRACGGQTTDAGGVPSGTLSGDGLTCTYASGREVIFDSPLTLPLDSKGSYSFTVKSGGKACFSFKCTGGGSSVHELAVGSATVRFEGIAPDQAALTCPDGAVYRGSYSALLKCESSYDRLEEILPGLVWQGSGTDHGGLEATGAGPDSPVRLFSCQQP